MLFISEVLKKIQGPSIMVTTAMMKRTASCLEGFTLQLLGQHELTNKSYFSGDDTNHRTSPRCCLMMDSSSSETSKVVSPSCSINASCHMSLSSTIDLRLKTLLKSSNAVPKESLPHESLRLLGLLWSIELGQQNTFPIFLSILLLP